MKYTREMLTQKELPNFWLLDLGRFHLGKQNLNRLPNTHGFEISSGQLSVILIVIEVTVCIWLGLVLCDCETSTSNI